MVVQKLVTLFIMLLLSATMWLLWFMFVSVSLRSSCSVVCSVLVRSLGSIASCVYVVGRCELCSAVMVLLLIMKRWLLMG